MLASYGTSSSAQVSERRELSGTRDAAELARRMKVSLVTSFPPSRGDLNEYGYHLACAMRDDPRVELSILADDADSQAELAGFRVQRCWRFDSVFNPVRLLMAIRKSEPDVVWFNIGFSTFARGPIAAFMATRLLLLSGDISVLLPSFQSEIINNYGVSADRVQARPHGMFGKVKGAHVPGSGVSGVSHSGFTERIILAFGYWGTYKRVDPLLESIERIRSLVPDAVLVIAGTNHPSAPGYLERLQPQWIGHPGVRFLGYVPETELDDLFKSASVLVLPYSSAAGTSGVVHQACQYGLPMVAAAIPEIVEITKQEKIAVEFYDPGDSGALANQLIRLLNSEVLRRSFSEQNLLAAQGTPISQVVDDYLRFFEQRVRNSRMQVTGL